MINKNFFLIGFLILFLLVPDHLKLSTGIIGFLGWLSLNYFGMAGTKEYEFLTSQIRSKAFIASKTYCPYCRSAIRFLQENGVEPKVIQLDKMVNGTKLQSGLTEITDGHNTVPYVFIGGKFIGGSDSLHALGKDNVKRLLANWKEGQ